MYWHEIGRGYLSVSVLSIISNKKWMEYYQIFSRIKKVNMKIISLRLKFKMRATSLLKNKSKNRLKKNDIKTYKNNSKFCLVDDCFIQTFFTRFY